MRNYLLTFGASVPTIVACWVLGIHGWAFLALIAAASFANIVGFLEVQRGWRS